MEALHSEDLTTQEWVCTSFSFFLFSPLPILLPASTIFALCCQARSSFVVSIGLAGPRGCSPLLPMTAHEEYVCVCLYPFLFSSCYPVRVISVALWLKWVKRGTVRSVCTEVQQRLSLTLQSRKKSKLNKSCTVSNVTICCPFRLCRTGGCREAEPCVLLRISNPQQFGAAREGGCTSCSHFPLSHHTSVFSVPKMNLQKLQFKAMHRIMFSNTVWKAWCCVKMHI